MIQIHLRPNLNSAQSELLKEGFHYHDHQHNGLLYIKEISGWQYKAVLDLNGRVFRYRPTKIKRFSHRREAAKAGNLNYSKKLEKFNIED